MKLLPILYWIILILSILGFLAPPTTYPNAMRYGYWTVLALLIIIGLHIFKVDL